MKVTGRAKTEYRKLPAEPASNALSLRTLFLRYRWRILATWSLVVLEAVFYLLLPLAMGSAIDSLLEDSFTGLWILTALGLLTLATGAARRFYDTRTYAGIYAEAAPELVQKERDRDTDVSTISARTGLASELVEFLENALPEVFGSFVGLVGALGIIMFLNVRVFVACLIATAAIALIYGLTSRRTYTLNRGYNSELEEQVRTLTDSDAAEVNAHFKRVAKWNIRLSDLETANFSMTWVFLMALLAYSIFAIIDSGAATQGRVFAVLLYVFNYMEAVDTLPFFYQQLVRLREISHRLA